MVASIFEVLGIPVSNADKVAKRVMNEDPELREGIIRAFGAEAYGGEGAEAGGGESASAGGRPGEAAAAGGMLNRKYLASQVFNDPAKLELLNSLVHPATIRDGQKWMRDLGDRYPYAIREAAIIFETSAAAHLDFIIGVYAPATLRIHRTMQRDQVTREEVLLRMKNQIDEDIKMRLCDAVIVNDDQRAVLPQVMELHQRLLENAKAKRP
jgi:dephospho-CoA kinase